MQPNEKIRLLGGVPASPRLRQEQVAELGLLGSLTNVPGCSGERDLADHHSVEINYERLGRRRSGESVMPAELR